MTEPQISARSSRWSSRWSRCRHTVRRRTTGSGSEGQEEEEDTQRAADGWLSGQLPLARVRMHRLGGEEERRGFHRLRSSGQSLFLPLPLSLYSLFSSSFSCNHTPHMSSLCRPVPVLHRLVDHDRRSGDVSDPGADEPRLPHVWRLLHHSFLHVSVGHRELSSVSS